MSQPLPTWLTEWRATVAPGRCPACRKALSPQRRGRRAYVHPVRDNPACRKEYLRRRQLATAGATSLREIKAVSFPKDRPGRARVRLSCGCTHDVQAHTTRRATKRMRCPNHS
jgi:hypothetical protein